MSDYAPPEVGAVSWIDLSVAEAETVRDFYAAVVGWTPEPVAMGGYDDFNMTAASGNPCAGICHAKGPNADLPSQWLIYITVADLDESVRKCQEQGGEVVAGPKSMGAQGAYAVIRDPAGAVCALYEPPR